MGAWKLFLALFLCLTPLGVKGNSELEMFDLVEEVGQNFYEVFELTEAASMKDIKAAYRRLSVRFHPDKNPDNPEEAATKFRQIVGIYEVLKDPNLRAAYQTVLVDGLPNWRQPIYYYRRYRKLTIWQVVVLVTLLISAAQYIGAWAAWLERRWSVEEMFSAKLRQKTRKNKERKDGKTEAELRAEMEAFLNKPSLWNILPFQTLRFGKYLLTGLPADLLTLYRAEMERREALRKEQKEAAALETDEPRKPKKRKVFSVPEKGEDDEGQAVWAESPLTSTSTSPPPVVRGGLWTDDDLAELSKLCSKYPGGTPNRWETIADLLRRPTAEVTFMAKKVLEGLSKRPDSTENQVKIKVKTKAGQGESLESCSWTAEEQKALEAALGQFPKGAQERWDRIAAAVKTKSKEECQARFKYLADLVKKKREEEQKVEAVETPELPDLDEEDYKRPKKGKKVRKRDLRRQDNSDSDDQDWTVLD